MKLRRVEGYFYQRRGKARLGSLVVKLFWACDGNTTLRSRVQKRKDQPIDSDGWEAKCMEYEHESTRMFLNREYFPHNVVVRGCRTFSACRGVPTNIYYSEQLAGAKTEKSQSLEES